MFGFKRITITSALPYINGVKHLGTLAGSILPADIFHRFIDLFGIPNIYICGTDEHGTPAEAAALEEGLDVKNYCDKYYEIQKKIYEQWNIDFTYFGRTSSDDNKKITQDIFLALKKNGFIIEKSLIIPYCIKCEKFLPDRFIQGTCPYCGYESAKGDQCEKCGKLLEPSELISPHCVFCGGDKIEFKEEKHLFVDFSKLQPKLKKWIEKNKQWPLNTRNFALAWIKEGLKPRCITRNLEWGIPVPLKGYEDLVFYVWFDAPIGYISMTKEWFGLNKKENEWQKWWTDSKIYHFLGKDNIPFHTIFWPGVLIGSGKYSLPYFVQGYEFLNWEGQKFSTSKHIGLLTDEALKLYPADYWRFYLSYILPERKDSDFNWKDFQDKINNELLANYGNLFYRVTSFIKSKFGVVPKPTERGEEEKILEAKLQETVSKVEKLIWEVKLRDALKEILLLASATNKYFQDKKPWNSSDSETTIYTAVNVLRTITILLYPFIPSLGQTALNALNVDLCKWSDISDFLIKPGHKVKPKILIKKIEDDDLKRKAKIS
ncbi:MAG: methionine--tRNA ligase [Candidatus Aenigmarchaeota archaeon]|nr:methionine--tRNA ligase [Candidatus Aenigmarchaeota archaeon]